MNGLARVAQGADGEEVPVSGGRPQLSGSRERHARESAARAAAHAGGISRESVRQFARVAEVDPKLAAECRDGVRSTSSAYRLVTGDDRVPLYLRVPAELNTLLEEEARSLGMSSRQQLVLALVTGWLRDAGDRRGEGEGL